MIELYNHTANEIAKITTYNYSSSFTLGIKAFDKSVRTPIYSIYAFARFADEIVDTFLSLSTEKRRSLLNQYKQSTYDAIKIGLSPFPILHAFQYTVNTYEIDISLIEAFFESMAMDIKDSNYSIDKYNNYIYGSAEVIGLMCLKVFVNGDNGKYLNLKPYAESLGAAFQKVNFLRDMKSDYQERGRVYFPNVNWNSFDQNAKQIIEKDISADFEHALIGIQELPKEAKKGVFLAYKYYYALFNKLKKAAPNQIQKNRIRISSSVKGYIMVKGLIRNYIGSYQ